MKNIVSEKCAKVVAKTCEKIAYSVSASACSWGTYQPKEPKALRK